MGSVAQFVPDVLDVGVDVSLVPLEPGKDEKEFEFHGGQLDRLPFADDAVAGIIEDERAAVEAQPSVTSATFPARLRTA